MSRSILLLLLLVVETKAALKRETGNKIDSDHYCSVMWHNYDPQEPVQKNITYIRLVDVRHVRETTVGAAAPTTKEIFSKRYKIYLYELLNISLTVEDPQSERVLYLWNSGKLCAVHKGESNHNDFMLSTSSQKLSILTI